MKNHKRAAMEKKNSIGIMQGRLTEPKGRGIQFFPFENWREEFYIAEIIHLDEIEFIFDYDNYLQNPLWKEGGAAVKRIVEETGIQVNSICFDYFMRRPFYKFGEQEDAVLEENKRVLTNVLQNMVQIGGGAKLVEIPLVDTSSLKSVQEADAFRKFLLEISNDAPGNISFGLETDLPPKKFRQYLESFDNKRIGANYDSGNSSGIGYEPYEEITTLKEMIFNIHIKDRLYHGKSVALGTGNADFKRLFKALKEIDYCGSFILQAARAEEGREKENIIEQVDFIKRFWN